MSNTIHQDNLPVVLLLGASAIKASNAKTLYSVPDELKDTKAAFEAGKEATRYPFEIDYEPFFESTDLGKLTKSNIAILHFAGHSDGASLQSEDGVLYSKHIANILVHNPPSLVFLNGCHNAEQVKLFHDAKVAVVIATHKPIKDGEARAFAPEFYRLLFSNEDVTLQQAFTVAGEQVFSKSQENTRSLDIDELDEADGDEWDWGLFAKEPKHAETWTIRHLLTESRPVLDAEGKPINPYRGLEAFREEDRAFFFGRDELTTKLLESIPKQRFFSLLGASGSGKSSLISAGVIPRLRAQKGKWLILSTHPGSDPFRELAGVLLESFHADELRKLQDADPLARLEKKQAQAKKKSELAEKLRNEARTLREAQLLSKEAQEQKEPNKDSTEEMLLSEEGILFVMVQDALEQAKAAQLLLFFDQFEELFTLASPEDAQVLQLLLSALVNTEKLPCTLLLTMRADFLAAALGYPELAKLLNKFPDEKLPPMDKSDVRAAIERPAKRQGVTIEDELVTDLLNDMQGQSDGLPLLQLVLTKLWEKGADDNLITLQEYKDLGRLAKTLETHAEEVFATLTIDEQKQCEQLFLKLIRYGEEASTRRPAYIRDLKQSVPDAESILAKLAASKARLIIMKQKNQDEAAYAEIAHEALIRHWDRLGGSHGWIAEHRDDLRIEGEITSLADKWKGSAGKDGDHAKRDLSYLLMGNRLQRAEEWLAKNSDSAEGLVTEFIQASIAERKRLKDDEDRKAEELRQQYLKANYNLAKVFEEKANNILTDEIINGEKLADPWQWRTAWLYGLEAAKQKVPEGKLAIQPASLRRLMVASEHDLSTERKQIPAINIRGIKALAYSPDGKVIASGSGDNTVRLWDAATGAELKILNGHTDRVSALAYSPDGKVLASGSGDNTVRLWDAATGAELKTLNGHTDGVSALAYSPDGKMLASSGKRNLTVRLWDTLTGTELKIPSRHTDRVSALFMWPDLWPDDNKHIPAFVYTLAYSPDGKVIASGSGSTVQLWDVSTREELKMFSGHQGDVYALAYSPDGKVLASGSKDSTVRLWDVATGAELKTFSGHRAGVYALAYSLDGKVLASSSGDRTVRLWDASTGKELKILSGHRAEVYALAYSRPDGKVLVSGSGDNTIRLWDAATSVELKTFSGHRHAVYALAYSPDSKVLASGSEDNTVRLWDAATGKELKRLSRRRSGAMYALTYSRPDGKVLASGSEDKTVQLWDAATGEELKSLSGHTDKVFALAYSSDGKVIASGSGDQTVRLWDAATGQELKTLSGHSASVSALAYSPDGKVIASGSGDQTVRLWDAATGQELKTLSGHSASVSALAYSPDGKVLASGGRDKTVRLWDTATGAELKMLSGHTSGVYALAYSLDGKILASGYGDTVRLWDTATGVELKALSDYTEGASALAYSPDGKVLASASGDTVRLWASSLPVIRLLHDFDMDEVSAVLRFLWELELDELDFKDQPRMLAPLPQAGGYYFTFTDETCRFAPLLEAPYPDETKLEQVVRFLEEQGAYKKPRPITDPTPPASSPNEATTILT